MAPETVKKMLFRPNGDLIQEVNAYEGKLGVLPKRQEDPRSRACASQSDNAGRVIDLV